MWSNHSHDNFTGFRCAFEITNLYEAAGRAHICHPTGTPTMMRILASQRIRITPPRDLLKSESDFMLYNP